MNDLFRRQYAITVKAAASGDARAFDVIASTDDVDMQGDVMVQDWNLVRYNSNPVVLYFHNFFGDDPEDTLPVGFATDVGVVDGKLRATLHFVDAKANPLAELCYQGFAQGSLRAVSVGFRSKLGRMETRNGQDVFVLSGNELLEISVCPVPINPNAVLDESKATPRDELLAFVKATNPRAAGAPDTEIPTMKTLLKALGLMDNASEAEALSALTAINTGAKSIESRVFEATGAKSLEEAVGIIKACLAARGELEVVQKALAASKADGEKRDRDAIVAKGVADKKLTPALKAWATAVDEQGAPKVSLETLKAFLENAPTHAALASGTGAVVTEAPPTEGVKSWEQMPPAEKHNLSVANPALYESVKADWERRGKPAMTYAAKK